MAASTIRGEFDEYVTSLRSLKQRLRLYQHTLGDRHVFAEHSGVLIVAIDGLLTKLEMPGLAETISLVDIVKIADEVRNVTTSASHFLDRRNVSVA
jgi:hypothetical protein